VVEDVHTGQILAMVSLPQLQQHRFLARHQSGALQQAEQRSRNPSTIRQRRNVSQDRPIRS
jgi:cell division protein FtsI/penicillin-binding protein 2